jgi:membrane-associated phospholipid phosphatase
MELKESYPILAWTGYAAAISTGILRVYKNRHWLHDVIAGAAVGIISTQLAYLVFRKRRKKTATPHSS